MAYIKLDTGVLESTLWADRECRDVFITALLMAMPEQLTKPTAQLEVRAIKETGFVVPPGWYGFVPAAGPGIVRRALVESESGLDALERLGAPDLESRTSEFDGRRLVRVDGGYLLLNYMKFRDKDHTNAERQKRLRERRKGEAEVTDSNALLSQSNAVTPSQSEPVTRYITQSDADADADAVKEKLPSVAKRNARDRATQFPDDFLITNDHHAKAKRLGLDLAAEFEQFRDDAVSKGKTFVVWPLAFSTWLGRAHQFGGAKAPPTPSKKPWEGAVN